MIQLGEPLYLIGIPIAFVIILSLTLITFVRLRMRPEDLRRQRILRVVMILTRTLLVATILLVLAGPYTEMTREVQGNPRVTVLIDRSGSMDFLDTERLDTLIEELKAGVPTTVRSFGTNLTSEVGSATLQNLEPGGNILLVTDGHATRGAALEDVTFYATTINASISMVNLTTTRAEYAVSIEGPRRTLSESDAQYEIFISGTSEDPVRLIVEIDDVVQLDKSVTPGTYPFTTQFATGEHRIEAVIEVEDTLASNNAFRASVRAIEKPRILLVTQKTSPLELLLRELYTVEKQSSLPSDLSPYYAVVINDVPVERLGNTQALHDFLIDEAGEYYGGGAVFFGGLDSYDKGGYAGSEIEQFLPVTVGQGERRKGTSNLVFIVDVSGGTGGTKYVVEGGVAREVQEEIPTASVIRAQVYAAVEQLRIENRVGVIVLGIPGGTSGTLDERIADSVKVLAPLDYLYNNRNEVLDRVSRIEGGGPTAADIAFQAAVEMLKNVQGDRMIILMSDGRYSAGLGAMSPQKQRLLNLAENAHKLFGIGFMGVGVGTENEALFPKKVDETFLTELARAGDGTYDRATRLNTLLIKYGDPKAKEYGQEFTLVPLSLTHFITRDIEPSAVLNAYNQVVPKDTATLLITSDSGQPALTTWQYGNGRVAAWTAFAGNNLGQLLNEENSLLISRTVNWAIGDPQRKEAYIVDIPDVRTNEQGTISIRSESPVTSDVLDFAKEGDTYTASFTPPEAGFHELYGAVYAVNRPREEDRVGMHPLLERHVKSTGGKVFKPTESDAIIEHVKAVSKRVAVEKNGQELPFIVAALVIFLIELLLRRLMERRA